MNILAVGAHWDDIELGCSLTLKALREKGHQLFCIIMCKAFYEIGAHRGLREQEAIESGRASFNRLGATYIDTPKAENGRLGYDKGTMQILETAARKNNIDTVFTHWFGDVNTDHKATWEITRTAFRNQDNFFMFQSNSYADFVNNFRPNFFFGFSEEQYRFKLELAATYEAEWEYRKERWEKEVFNRERHWGYLCGHDYAEAFQIGKVVANGLLAETFPA